MRRIPLRDQPNRTREESALKNTDQEASNAQPGKGACCTGESHDDAPACDEDADVVARSLEFREQDVAGDFAEDLEGW